MIYIYIYIYIYIVTIPTIPPILNQQHYHTTPIPSIAADSVWDILIPVPLVSGQSVPQISTCKTLEPALVVNLPPRPPIVNEILYFVQNKIKQLPFDSLGQLCTYFV